MIIYNPIIRTFAHVCVFFMFIRAMFDNFILLLPESSAVFWGMFATFYAKSGRLLTNRPLSDMSVFAPFSGRRAHVALKIPIVGRDGRKTRPSGNAQNRFIGAAQQIDGTVDAEAVDVLQRRHAHDARKRFAKVTLAQGATVGHLSDANLLRVIL